MELRSRRISKEPSHRAASPLAPARKQQTRKTRTRTEGNPGFQETRDDRETREKTGKPTNEMPNDANLTTRRAWLVYAVGSGMCAALNGVFAKLTTTQLTGQMSAAIANALGISHYEYVVQFLCRAVFFVLNLTFNGIMWTLFTTALRKGSSATQVTVLNSSANFLVTAFAGMLIFAESLPPMWWAGAALLVAGSVVAGRRDREREEEERREQEERGGQGAALEGVAGGEGTGLRGYRDEEEEDEDVPDLGGP